MDKTTLTIAIGFLIAIPLMGAFIIYTCYFNPRLNMPNWDQIKDADDSSLSWGERYKKNQFLKMVNLDKKSKTIAIIVCVAFTCLMELGVLGIFGLAILLTYLG